MADALVCGCRGCGTRNITSVGRVSDVTYVCGGNGSDVTCPGIYW